MLDPSLHLNQFVGRKSPSSSKPPLWTLQVLSAASCMALPWFCHKVGLTNWASNLVDQLRSIVTALVQPLYQLVTILPHGWIKVMKVVAIWKLHARRMKCKIKMFLGVFPKQYNMSLHLHLVSPLEWGSSTSKCPWLCLGLALTLELPTPLVLPYT